MLLLQLAKNKSFLLQLIYCYYNRKYNNNIITTFKASIQRVFQCFSTTGKRISLQRFMT